MAHDPINAIAFDGRLHQRMGVCKICQIVIGIDGHIPVVIPNQAVIANHIAYCMRKWRKIAAVTTF